MSIVKRIRKGLRYILTGKPVKYVKAEISYLVPDRRLAGKKIFVTGGSRGIGRAMAEKFVKEGAEVMISGRNEEVLKEVSSSIGCAYVVADMNDTDSFDSLPELLISWEVLISLLTMPAYPCMRAISEMSRKRDSTCRFP